jgi:flavin-dependent dehydrogenase
VALPSIPKPSRLMSERWDVVVAGAGPAGSATALLLARAGVRVLLLDRARFPRDKPCSEYLSPAATPLLQRLDPSLVPALEHSSPGRLYGMRVFGPDGTAALGRFAAGHRFASPRPYGFAVSRTILDTLLVEAAGRAGVHIEQRTLVEDLLFDQGAVGGVVARDLTANRRTTHRARVVVGADGLRSVVARRLGLARRMGPRRIAFSAHYADVAGVGACGEMHIGRPGYVGLGPIGEDVTTVALVLPAPTSSSRDGRRLPTDDLIPELERFPALRGRFAQARLVRPILVTGPFAQRSRHVVAPGGGALLVGDAADFFDPFTGQGLYSALRGAELAAETVLNALRVAPPGPVTATTLAPYAAGRRQVFGGRWVLERLIGIGVGWPWLARRVVRRLAQDAPLADLLVGAAGNFVPVRAVLTPSTLWRYLR